MQVYISESAFLGLLVSAIEVFKKECYGLLLGHRDKEMFIVDHAVACQKAERHSSWVKAKEKSYKKVVKFFENLPNLYIIGDFHSHPKDGGPMLSSEDIEGMVESEVYIVIDIKEKNKDKWWGYNDDGTLSGTTDNYFLKIAAYYLNNSTGKPKSADIICPFAIGFDIKERRADE